MEARHDNEAGRNTEVRVRVAPSPTGEPHVGTAYVALMNYAFARQKGGKLILRIEDTDRERSSRESELAIIEGLRWLGLEWDEGPDVGGPFGPYRQSERSEIYKQYAYELVERGRAYPCFCSPEKLAEIRRRQRERKANVGYDGTCRGLDREEALARVGSGEPHVIRLAVPRPGHTAFRDLLRGTVAYDNGQIDDQVLLKSDGFPTYHLASVVDDHLMKITHVIRAEEWVNSTPKHVMLYDALGWEAPTFVHLPLLRNKDRSKISKRRNPVSLFYYRQIGILPETMVNFLGLIGHSMPDEREVFGLDDFMREFSFERVKLGGPVFDMDKLLWLNGVRIRQLDVDGLVQRLRDGPFSEGALRRLVPLLQVRLETLGEFVEKTWYFYHHDLEPPIAEIVKASGQLTPKELAGVLEDLAERLESLKKFDAESIEGTLRTYCEEKGYKTSKVFMPIRLAVTGRKATPSLFHTMEALSRSVCCHRLRKAARQLQT